MSGPVGSSEAPVSPAASAPTGPTVEVTDARSAVVGTATVRRALPQRRRRTVGAWCFADHMGPTETAADIAPHPHTGLQTVTWLLDGRLLHRDSLGSEQPVAPGQLNLMTAGNGVSHSEETVDGGLLEGIQLWVAQPGGLRLGEAAFEHHGSLPALSLPGGSATVLVGALGGVSSPARADTPLVGADLAVSAAVEVPLEPAWEHALVVLRGAVGVEGTLVGPGRLAYLGVGRASVALDPVEPSRVMLLGGEPFAEPVVMWWNFVARSRIELEEAYASWQRADDRFGRVASDLPRIPAPDPYWTRSA